MKIRIMTDRKFREAVRREAAFLLERYSDNPALLKAARAAFENVSVEALDRLNVARSETAINPMRRAIRAYARGLAGERAGL